LATPTRTYRANTNDYRTLFLQDAPLMDVRAPVEFDKGSFPTARNLPLLNDDERRQVGTCYKEQGQEAAIALGQQLVHEQIKRERMVEWTNFAKAHETDGYLYCFRGGLRSNIVQQWIEQETGIRLPLVQGGYKAMRQFLIEELDRSLAPNTTNVIRICGATGSGKTLLIGEVPEKSVDLEGLAHHRGSTFGRWPEAQQPSQIDFENSLSIKLLKLIDKFEKSAGPNSGKACVFVEDEGSRIGSVSLPLVLRERMAASEGVVLVDEALEDRVNVIMEDYGFDLGRRYAAIHGAELGMQEHRDFLLESLSRCRKRLGGERYARVNTLMEAACAEQGGASSHRALIEWLLTEYYDPMYEYQLEQGRGIGKVLFRGKRDAAIEYCKAYASL
jgi:tRNA 2-selenouridine synthase